MLDKKLICITLELATADYIVHSLHAFTIHVALCDGPGRGGTCQMPFITLGPPIFSCILDV